MKRWAKVESAFSEWIGAREFLTHADRMFLAKLLFMHFYDITYPSKAEFTESGFPERHPNWGKVIQEVLSQHSIRAATKNHEEFAMSVAKDMLRWCLSMNIRFLAHHDYQRGESHIHHVGKHIHTLPADTLLQRISELLLDFPEKESQWRFYQRAFEAERHNGSSDLNPDQLVLREKFLAEWQEEMHSNRQQTEAVFLEGKLDTYIGDLSEKAERLEELEELLDPFSQFLGQAWNASLGNWKAIDWTRVRAIAKQLKSDQQMHDLLEWLGRLKSSRKARELRRKNLPLPKQLFNPNPFGKSEIIGVHYSNELDSVLPSEIALLSDEDMEVIFSEKYIEHKLLTFQYRSLDVEQQDDPDATRLEPSDSESSGPFILCIDTSGSMYGTPEQVAKGLALSLTELALKEQRSCYLIAFSTGIRAIELTGMEKDFEALVKFLKMSFHGSTDLQPAIEEANRLLQTERFRQADVLVISDFLIPRLDRDILYEIKQLKHSLGVRYHSMFIGRSPDSTHVPLPVFDHHWIYDLNHPGVMKQWVEYLSVIGRSNSW